MDFETLRYLKNCHHHHLHLSSSSISRRDGVRALARPLAGHAPCPWLNPPCTPLVSSETAPFWHLARLPRAPAVLCSRRRCLDVGAEPRVTAETVRRSQFRFRLSTLALTSSPSSPGHCSHARTPSPRAHRTPARCPQPWLPPRLTVVHASPTLLGSNQPREWDSLDAAKLADPLPTARPAGAPPPSPPWLAARPAPWSLLLRPSSSQTEPALSFLTPHQCSSA